MKILIDTSPLNSEHAIRGIGTYTRELVAHLEKIKDLEVIRTSQLEESQSVSPDITHYPFFDLFFNTLPVSLGKPTVVTIHDVIPLKFPEHYPPGVKGKLRFNQQKLALKTVSRVITDSQSSKQDIVELLGVPAAKTHVVHLAANPDLQAQPTEVIKKVSKKYNLPEKYLLYVGDINYNKNIPQLIKMVKFLPEELQLVCLGKNFVEQDIPEWQWIETQLAMSDVEERVTFLNNVLTDSNKDLAAIYSGATAYVQPSLYEGFGLPVLEAMQCKTPVVATAVASLPEVAGENAIYVEPEAESLAGGVDAVLSWSETERQEQIEAAYQWSQSFSWQETAAQTHQVYQAIINENEAE